MDWQEHITIPDYVQLTAKLKNPKISVC